MRAVRAQQFTFWPISHAATPTVMAGEEPAPAKALV